MDWVPRDLTVPGLALRAPQHDDAAALWAFAQDPDMDRTRWLGLAHGCTPALAAAFVTQMLLGWTDPAVGRPAWLIERAGELAGMIDLRFVQPGLAEVSYGLAPEHRGRGAASGALGALTGWANAQELELELRIDPKNTASQRVAERAGYRFRGREMAPGYEHLGYEDLVYRSR